MAFHCEKSKISRFACSSLKSCGGSRGGQESCRGRGDRSSWSVLLSFVRRAPRTKEFGSEGELDDAYKAHFGPETSLLSATALAAISENVWASTEKQVTKLGKVKQWSVASSEALVEPKVRSLSRI